MSQKNCIAVTLPKDFFNTRSGGRERFDRDMENVDSGNSTWHHTICSKPKVEPEFLYFVHNGSILLRMTVLKFEGQKTKNFMQEDGSVTTYANKRWVICCGPVVWAPKGKYPMKGFQGFRYVEFLF